MPVTLRDFMSAMNEWYQSVANETSRRALPPSTWMKVRGSGVDTNTGTTFDPAQLVQLALDGREDMLAGVAVPLAGWLNERFQPGGRGQVPGPGGAAPAPQTAPASPPEPQAAPTTSPAAAQEPAASVQGKQAAESQEESEAFLFPAYDYSRDDLDSLESDGNHVPVTVEHFEGRLRYSWPDPGDGEVYRVVVSDQEDPYTPDDFEQVAATRATQAWDSTELTTAVRFVTVWAYESHADGALGQCRRVASKVLVHDLRDWQVETDRETHSVLGTWTRPVAPPGAVVRVRSARLPLNQPPGRFIKTSAWMSYELENNGSGFRDTEVTGGKKYNYVACVEVTVNGQVHTSKPVLRSITPEAAIERITDMTAVEVPDPTGKGGSTLEITWTQEPQTTVVVYRTQKAVTPQACERDELPESSLATAHLEEDSRISTRLAQVTPVEGTNRTTMTLSNVPWPQGRQWDALHLTPVTLHSEGMATIGAPLRLKRAGGVRNVTLVRRLSWDLVAFTWPGDAASVEMRYTMPGQELDPTSPATRSVTKEEYHAEGGFVLDPGLPPQGGQLHLNSVTYLQGRQIPSPRVTLEVAPRWTYHYSLSWPGDSVPLRGLGRLTASVLRQTLVELRVTPTQGYTDSASAIGVVLLHNPTRLPLQPNDGTPVPLFQERPTKEGGQKSTPVVTLPPHGSPMSLWFDHSPLAPGYLRLMVNSGSSSHLEDAYQQVALERFALVDPGLESLTKRR